MKGPMRAINVWQKGLVNWLKQENKIIADHAAYVTEITDAANKTKIRLENAECEAMSLRQSNQENQRQVAEARLAVTTMAAEITAAREVANSATQQSLASIQAIQLLLQEKESLNAEYQTQFDLATNASAKNKIAEANVDRLRKQKDIADLLLQNLQLPKEGGCPKG